MIKLKNKLKNRNKMKWVNKHNKSNNKNLKYLKLVILIKNFQNNITKKIFCNQMKMMKLDKNI